MRGFNVGLSEQQIGMTIDGLPNGNSNYGGGTPGAYFIGVGRQVMGNLTFDF